VNNGSNELLCVCVYPECSARDKGTSAGYISPPLARTHDSGMPCSLYSVWIEEVGDGAAPGMATSRAMIP
jgi:hypothetical protein